MRSNVLKLLLSGPLIAISTASPVSQPFFNSHEMDGIDGESSLVRRSSKGISSFESHFLTQRKIKTDAALIKWLSRFVTRIDSTTLIPRVSMTSSGGAYGGFLLGAGILSEFDERDNEDGVLAGLYQALTYHSGVSAGAVLIGSLAGNGYPTVSTLRDRLWLDRLEKGILWYPSPPNPEDVSISSNFQTDVDEQIRAESELWRTSKQANNASEKNHGLNQTMIDAFARIFAYHFLQEGSDRWDNTLSNLANLPEFRSHAVPFPIMLAHYVPEDQCLPSKKYPTFEFHPFEYGSWDNGVAAFAQTKRMESKPFDNPAYGRQYQMYDHLSVMMATSANILFPLCEFGNEFADMMMGESWVVSKYLNEVASGDRKRDYFSVFPNPFIGIKDAGTLVSSSKELKFVDGGAVKNLNPVWPLIQNARAEFNDVIIVADMSGSWGSRQSGYDLHSTWKYAQKAGLKHMPEIPPPSTFVAFGLDQRASFFGCESRNTTAVIVYIPHTMYPNAPIASNQTFLKTSYTKEESLKMIEVGSLLATQNGNSEWPFCLACAIMLKTSIELPDGCATCLQRYCWNGTVVEDSDDEEFIPWEGDY